jgi:glycosyltransferase involved in cell wall biosynthesis
MRTRVVLVRPFSSRKYAVDVAVRVIVELSRRPRFGELHFALHGDGPRFESLTAPLRGFPNVALHRGFLPQPELPGLYREHGVFLCPTRQDAQGVSMCEAMASGLVPVSTGVTAIPEFIRHGENGLLSRGVGPMADHIEALAGDPALFARLSAEAARSMRERCGGDQVAAQELAVVAEAVRHAPGTSVPAAAWSR